MFCLPLRAGTETKSSLIHKKKYLRKMILSRKINLNQFKSIVISQQNKIFLITQSPRTLHNSSFLTKQSEGSNKPSDSQRIYYGKE